MTSVAVDADHNQHFHYFVCLQSRMIPAESDCVQQDLPGVENVITRQFLGTSDHFLTTDDTDVVRSLQVLRSSIRISEHVKTRNQL